MIAPIYTIGKIQGENKYGVFVEYLTKNGETRIKERIYSTEIDCLEEAIKKLQDRNRYLKKKAREK